MAQTRITAGDWRGRVITTPRGLPLRPTRSLVREALFNILGGTVVDARMLDLYAGAGSVGFEALSRGAEHVTFIEKHRPALALIADTAQRFDCEDRCQLTPADVVGWLRGPGQRVLPDIDICFIDAPYRDPGVDAALAILGAAPPALVVCEHHRERRLAEQIGGLVQTRQAHYGLTTLSFYKPAGATASE